MMDYDGSFVQKEQQECFYFEWILCVIRFAPATSGEFDLPPFHVLFHAFEQVGVLHPYPLENLWL
ncbi:MAG: hypothetical protein ACTSU9_10895 [Promethearchaeota archaeon]